MSQLRHKLRFDLTSALSGLSGHCCPRDTTGKSPEMRLEGARYVQPRLQKYSYLRKPEIVIISRPAS